MTKWHYIAMFALTLPLAILYLCMNWGHILSDFFSIPDEIREKIAQYRHQKDRRLHPELHFKEDPWMCRPSEEWNSATGWERYYGELMNDLERSTRLPYKKSNLILDISHLLSEWPIRKVLCAGCGVTAEPHVFAWMGYQATALDLSAVAIRCAVAKQWNVEELAKTIKILEKVKPDGRDYNVIVDPKRTCALLEERHRLGGLVDYRVGDWSELAGEFDLIFCRDSLRGSTKPYWEKTLKTFHQRLAPGGVLVVITLNAIAIEEEVRGIAASIGYTIIRPNYLPDSDPLPLKAFPRTQKYFLGLWPTG